jgi:macrophage erythroblast attacher
MLAKMKGLKRKLSAYADEEARLYKQVDARVAHLSELGGMHTVDDVRYQEWSRQRLDRLLVDYLLRHGYSESAAAMAHRKGMQDLVDIETFLSMNKIRKSLEDGSVTEALAWCNENKKELRKMDVSLCLSLLPRPDMQHD